MINLKMSESIIKGNVDFNGSNIVYRIFEKPISEYTYGYNKNEREYNLHFIFNNKTFVGSFLIDLEDKMVSVQWLDNQDRFTREQMKLWNKVFNRVEDNLTILY